MQIGYFELAKIYIIKGNKEIALKYIQIALDGGNKKIIDKIKKDPIFVPIIARIALPFNSKEDIDDDKTKNKLTKTEITVKEYLEKTAEITRNLSYNDIKFLKKYKENKLTKTFEENNIYINNDKQNNIDNNYFDSSKEIHE